MKLIVISYADTIANEAEIINALFDEGLELFHLRKPNFSEREQIDLLKKIKKEYHSRIAIHQHYSIAEKFGIKRIHFSENDRLTATEEELKELKKNIFIFSTSIHSIGDYEKLSDTFSYTFLGPVFESISKPGYKPQSEEIIKLKENKNRGIKIIAIGGISITTIEKVKQSNFDGAAMLGVIWNDTTNAIECFKKCRKNANM
jgi:thiamine-phosphate pyrophosphorylase